MMMATTDQAGGGKQQTEGAKTAQAPAAHVRQGNLEAAIWRNQGENGAFYTVSFSRKFQVEGEWRESSSFRERDVNNLAKLAFDTHTKIQDLKEADREG